MEQGGLYTPVHVCMRVVLCLERSSRGAELWFQEICGGEAWKLNFTVHKMNESVVTVLSLMKVTTRKKCWKERGKGRIVPAWLVGLGC